MLVSKWPGRGSEMQVQRAYELAIKSIFHFHLHFHNNIQEYKLYVRNSSSITEL